MGIFKKKYAGSEGSSSSLNAFLGSGTEYSGRLEFTGTVRIDGAFEGEIVADGALVLGRDASITGQVQVGTLVSNGHVHGDVVVNTKAILQKSSVLSGSLKTGALVVEEGAAIEGTVEMSSRDPKRKGAGRASLDAAAPEVPAAVGTAVEAAVTTEDEPDEIGPLDGDVESEPVRGGRIS